MPKGALASVATTPTISATFLPRKPNAISPSTTPIPMTESTSLTIPRGPLRSIQLKRTGMNAASAATTAAVKATLVTRCQ